MVEEFNIRLAKVEDMEDIFNLSNDDLVRANSFNQEKIQWEDHQKWFKDKISNEDSIFYVAETPSNNFIGYVRLEKEKKSWIITIHITNNYRNKRLGREILKKICNLNADKIIIAFVKEKNLPSLKSFEGAAFKKFDLVSINNERYYKLKYECNCNK